MKPKNFPERKRQRQIAALRRLIEQNKESYNLRVLDEIEILEERTAVNLRDVRTKKRRATI